MAQTNNLSNINFMSKERFDSLTEIDDNQLYAVEFPFNDEDLVHTHSDEEINGEKTFNSSPIVPTILDTKDASKKVATTEFVQNVANTKQDIATAVNYDNITNCITEIPQDIKLELLNGELKVLAETVGYMPNGFESDGTTPKFEKITLPTDASLKQLYDNDEQFVVLYHINAQSTFIGIANLGKTYESRPTPIGDYSLHYVKNENKCLWDVPEGFIECTFPIANVARSSSDGFTKINQIFNGFGYIGSTVFALPGVKGLIPNGRNDDGTLNNILVQITSVTINSYSGTNKLFWGFTSGNHIYYQTQSAVIYDEKKNTTNWNTAIFASGEVFNGTTISNFVTKTTFHAVDYNEVKSVVFPSQTGNAGKALLTDGENTYWGDTSGVIIRDWSS